MHLVGGFSDRCTDIPTLTAALVRHPAPYRPFLPLLKNNDDTVRLLSAAVLTGLLSHAVTQNSKNASQVDEALPQLFSYLSALAKASDASFQDIAVRFYSAVLQSKKARHVFWKQKDETLNPLFDILRAAAGATKDTDSTLYSSNSVRSAEGGLSGGVGLQLLYHVLLVIWQLSFEGELIGEGLQECVAVPGRRTNLLTCSVTKTSSYYIPSSSVCRLKRRRPDCFSPPS